MEESAASSPPDEDALAAKAAPEVSSAQAETPRHERRRFHVPTSVLVTILVALLSVWSRLL